MSSGHLLRVWIYISVVVYLWMVVQSCLFITTSTTTTCLTIMTKYLGTDFLGTIFNIIVIHYTDDSDSDTDMPFGNKSAKMLYYNNIIIIKLAFTTVFALNMLSFYDMIQPFFEYLLKNILIQGKYLKVAQNETNC